MSSLPIRRISLGQYLAVERQALHRSEYHAGEVVALAGANRRHNRVVTNLTTALDNQLKDRPCNVYASDLRVWIASGERVLYPDVVVTCGEEHFLDTHDDVLLNPLIVIEVLSASTEAYDRGKKREQYQRLPSLQEYLLVAQDAERVEHYRRGGETWRCQVIFGAEATVTLPSIGCTLTLREVYAKVSGW